MPAAPSYTLVGTADFEVLRMSRKEADKEIARIMADYESAREFAMDQVAAIAMHHQISVTFDGDSGDPSYLMVSQGEMDCYLSEYQQERGEFSIGDWVSSSEMDG